MEAKNAGLTPNVGVPASGDASSTTKSAISAGSIEVRSNSEQDLSSLSRDPSVALNALGQIFDKKTVQEKQELANVFGEVAYEQVHIIAKANGWDEGSPQKIALHAFVGAIMADLGGGSALSGAVGAGVNEAVQKALAEKFKDDPAMHQWASGIIGAAAAKVVGGNAQTGASTAASGTKNNYLNSKLQEEFAEELAKCTTEEERKAIIEKYWDISQNLNQEAANGNADSQDIIESTTTISSLQKELEKVGYDSNYSLDYNLSQLAAKTNGTISDIAVDMVQVSDNAKRAIVRTAEASVTLWIITAAAVDNSLRLSDQQMALGINAGDVVVIGAAMFLVKEAGELVPTTLVMQASTNNPNGTFANAPYHGSVGNSVKSKAPENGQRALDNSVQVKDTSPRRVGVSEGEIVVLDRTTEGVYHGHVRKWEELTTEMQNALRKAGLVDKKGNVIK